MAKKDPKRVGATIERTALKRMLSRLRKQVVGLQYAEQVVDIVYEYACGRVKRFSKEEGGL